MTMLKEKIPEEIRYQKRFKSLVRFLSFYTLFLFSGFLFSSFYHRPKEAEPENTVLYGNSSGPDGAVLVEDRLLSGLSRVNLIENAQSSLQIAYHTVHDGLSADIFYGVLLEAAERGVTVELLFDGVLHNLRGKERETYWALIEHPNISVRFYEPLNLLKPWALNNRLHDKFIVVDHTLVLLGGRNIGDKYFLNTTEGTVVEDRDVLIVTLDAERKEESVLAQFDSYFEQLWNHSYTKERHKNLSERAKGKARVQQQILLENLAQVRQRNPQHFFERIEWQEYVLPTQKVTLITNSLERVNKTPRILNELGILLSQAKEQVLLQSPYIIFSRNMRAYLKAEEIGAELIFLTNSQASSPNYFAVSGYLKHRQRLAQKATQIYEYHGPGSIHAKSYIFDSRLSLVGSYNLDARSSFLSTESMVAIDSEAFAEVLTEKMVNLAAQSVPLLEEHSPSVSTTVTQRPVPWYKRFVIKLTQIVLGPFDALL